MWRNEQGQALVEFSLVVVLFLMLLSGLIDISRIAGTWVIMANASREGARIGALGRSDTDIFQAVKGAATTLDLSRLQITVKPGPASRGRGVPMEVRLNYTVDLLMPFTGVVLQDPTPLQVATVMRME